MNKDVLMETTGLRKQFDAGKHGGNHAVDGVSIQIRKGRTLGVVGESGCGKSTLGRMLAGILAPTEGSIFYEGCDLAQMTAAQRRSFRQKCQMVWQDPYSSLDPRMKAADIVGEGMLNFGLAKKKDVREKAAAWMERCGLYREWGNRYPHEFSGGQRQRLCIARALAAEPEFLVCDEAVSALDVSIQAQIVNLLKDLQEQMGLTYLFISHDLSIVNFMSDDVIVMYRGQIVEQGPMELVYKNRAHPYTQTLYAASPVFAEACQEETIAFEEEAAEVPETGCRYRHLCKKAQACCQNDPPFYEIEPGHFVRCHARNSSDRYAHVRETESAADERGRKIQEEQK